MISNNPHITIIMNTNGKFPELLKESVYSALNQTYKNITFLLTCASSNALRLNREYNNLKVFNTPVFETYLQQVIYSLKNVESELWTPFDSDDYITPTHIEEMVKNLLVFQMTQPDMDKSFMFSSARSVLSFRNKIIAECKPNWWSCLFSKPTIDQISYLENIFDYSKNTPTKARFTDSYVIDAYPTRYRNVNSKITYLYRQGIASHISNPSLVGQESLIIPIITPKLDEEYDRQIKEFEDSVFVKDMSMSTSSLSLFSTIINKDTKVVEVGCGNSTVLLHAFSDNVTSFENNDDKRMAINNRISPNIVKSFDYFHVSECDVLYINEINIDKDVINKLLAKNPKYIFFNKNYEYLPIKEMIKNEYDVLRLPSQTVIKTIYLKNGVIIDFKKKNDTERKINKNTIAKNKIKAKPITQKPNIFTMIGHFSKAMQLWSKQGFPVVTKEEYIRRRSICNDCSGGYTCPKCGCMLWAKSALETENCDQW